MLGRLERPGSARIGVRQVAVDDRQVGAQRLASGLDRTDVEARGASADR